MIRKLAPISGWAALALGIVHCLATPLVMQMGFGSLPTPLRNVFLFAFIATGVALALTGYLQLLTLPYLASAHPLAWRVRKLCAIFILALGAAAVIAMYDNPFAYLTLVTGALSMLSSFPEK